jgi:hypothetical protein
MAVVTGFSAQAGTSAWTCGAGEIEGLSARTHRMINNNLRFIIASTKVMVLA